METNFMFVTAGIVHFVLKVPFPDARRLGLREDGCIWGRWKIGTQELILTRTGVGPSLARNWHESLTGEAVAEVETPIWKAIEEMIENEPGLKKLVYPEPA